jgi:hypothetical protein
MSHIETRDGAAAYLFAAYNETEHADSLVKNARASFDHDLQKTIEDLKLALVPAGRSANRIQDAIDYLERLAAIEVSP